MSIIAELENEVRLKGEHYRAARGRFAAAVRLFDQSPSQDLELSQPMVAAESALIQAWTAFAKAKDALRARGKARPPSPPEECQRKTSPVEP